LLAELSIIAGIFVVLGHNYTCWLKFKGGKGHCDDSGSLSWRSRVASCWELHWSFLFWTALLTRYVSVGSIAAAIALPLRFGFCLGRTIYFLASSRRRSACWRFTNINQTSNGSWLERKIGLAKNLQRRRSRNENHRARRGRVGNGALAKVLHENGNAVTIWDINPETLKEIQNGRSEKYLPGVALPTDWKTEADFKKAIGGAECVVLAIPSQAFRQVAEKLKGHPGIFVSVTKGIEFETGETMSRILREQAPANRVVALSGPSFAREVAVGNSDDGRVRLRKRRDGKDCAGTFSSPGISDLSQHGHSGRGIRRRVEKHHRHRGGRERRSRLRRQHEGRTRDAGVVGNAAAGRGVRRRTRKRSRA
jgi:hypothetical protein